MLRTFGTRQSVWNQRFTWRTTGTKCAGKTLKCHQQDESLLASDRLYCASLSIQNCVGTPILVRKLSYLATPSLGRVVDCVSVKPVNLSTFRNFSVSSASFGEAQVTEIVKDAKEQSVEKVVSSAAATNEASTNTTIDASQDANSKELVLDFLPEKPQPLGATELFQESSLEALGLASWWPSGRIQYFMDYLHVSFDMPWWQTIVLCTVILRLCTFPLVVMSQKNAAHLNNYMPQMQALQYKLSDARSRGDTYDSAVAGMQLQKFMKEKKLNPLKNIVPLLGQLPIFMSMFFGLRGMANLPLESMMDGGFSWLNDLTVADPFYVLPVLISVTTYLSFKFAADGAGLESAGPFIKLAMKAMPVIMFPITMNFPAAITFYWFITNVISVIQAKIIRTEAIRNKLGIPKMVKWDKNKLPVKDKGVRETIRESIDNWKVQADIADRRVYDETIFREAGTRKPVRTFKFDPTKQRR